MFVDLLIDFVGFDVVEICFEICDVLVFGEGCVIYELEIGFDVLLMVLCWIYGDYVGVLVFLFFRDVFVEDLCFFFVVMVIVLIFIFLLLVFVMLCVMCVLYEVVCCVL